MKRSIANKRQSRAFRVLLILLIVALAFSGCRQEAALEKGFGHFHTRNSIMLGVRSNTDIFAKDDVTLELYYGTYDIDYCKNDVDAKASYCRTHLADSKIIFGLYVYDPQHSPYIISEMKISDYRAIDNYYFVKEISEEDAFSEEYGLTTSRWCGITYNHREEITIPSEFFSEESGRFNIELIAFLESNDEEAGYYTTVVSHQEFGYQTLDENTVKITS